MVCNCNCRPRESELKDIRPAYRSDKQLDTTHNRYEKQLKKKGNDSPSGYTRIDFPVSNLRASVLPEVNYVPVSITIKKSSFKKWPSDQNGIESPDDLALYNNYINNAQSEYSDSTTPTPTTTPTSSFNGYLPPPHNKPSILILEELTPKPQHDGYPGPGPPYYMSSHIKPPAFPVEVELPPSHLSQNQIVTASYPSVYASKPRPIHVYNQSPVVTKRPIPIVATSTVLHVSTPRPIQVYDQPHLVYQDTTQSPSQSPSDVLYHGYLGQAGATEAPVTLNPETTTKKQKRPDCHTVGLVATNSGYGPTSQLSNGCLGVQSIGGTTVESAGEVVAPVAPHPPATYPAGVTGVVLQNDNIRPTHTGFFSVFEILWATLSKFFNFFFFKFLC